MCSWNAPAMLAFVMATVWNHIGKKYMMLKLQVATRKLLSPTRTGIFCFSRNGAMTGSGEMKISTVKKSRKKTIERTSEAIQAGCESCLLH
jgi:hypothetical protein